MHDAEQALMLRGAPIKEQPWVRPTATGISGANSTPDNPASVTRSAI